MRSKLRISVLAVSVAASLMLSATGCAQQATNEFTESESVPAISQSVVSGVDMPAIIDNTGKFTYASNKSKYSDSIRDAAPIGLTCAGYSVYQDTGGQQFVISGDERIDLEENKRIPESFRGDLRIEQTGGKLYVYKTEEDAEQARDAVTAAKNAQEGITTDAEVITVNGSKLYLNGAKIVKVDDDVFIPCEAVLQLAGDGSHLETSVDMITFFIYNYAESKLAKPQYEEFVIDLQQPNVIWTADKSAHLESDADLVRVNEKTQVLYFNPEELATVFDWQVSKSVPFKNGTGCLSIVTDPTMDLQSGQAAIMVSEDLAIQTEPEEEIPEAEAEEIQAALEAELEEIMSQADSVPETAPSPETPATSSAPQSQAAAQAAPSTGNNSYGGVYVSPVTGVINDYNNNGEPDDLEDWKSGKVIVHELDNNRIQGYDDNGNPVDKH